jgi:hypothetical protein
VAQPDKKKEAMKQESSSEGCLRGAWDAILRGDYAERDRLCERGKALADAEDHARAVETVMSRDFYVTPSGTVIPTKRMAKVAGAVQ